MRIVLDTNNIVSGLLRRDGPSGELIRRWTDADFTLVTSQYQIDELRRVLSYNRIRTRVSPEEADEFLSNMAAVAHVAVDLPEITISSDPADNPILASGIAGDVDFIVTGDKKHVASLGNIEGIPIVTARVALARLNSAP